MNIEHLN